jgi:hypothetical protein
MKYTLLAIPLILVLLVVGYLDKPPTESEQVYNACIKAHDEAVLNMFDENYCGALQDDYKLKFVCESRDSKPNTKCRVEEL